MQLLPLHREIINCFAIVEFSQCIRAIPITQTDRLSDIILLCCLIVLELSFV